MMQAFDYEAFEQIVFQSELGLRWIEDPLLYQDVWPLSRLGYSQEECQINSRRNLYFEDFSLPWLKLLTKLTVKARIRGHYSLGTVVKVIDVLRHLNKFLIISKYNQPEDLNDALIQQFLRDKTTCGRENTQSVLSYCFNIWSEENWLKIRITPHKRTKRAPKIKTIPEEVLHQVYENFELLPPMLERLFRLQLALGCRIGEMLRLPRQCLKKEGECWFLLRWIGKRKHWKFQRVHPLIAEIIQEQQQFLNVQFGCDCDFNNLFCYLSGSGKHIKNIDLAAYQPKYKPKHLPQKHIQPWLNIFSVSASLRDKQGNNFIIKSHMFRRTKASVMSYCEIEDTYIAAVLGHASLDMLPHYRKRSLELLEKEAKTKGYVDMYGRVTTFKPKKRRYEQLAELLKISTPLGECHRPYMLGDCQLRYACLSCDHHRVTLEDQPQLIGDCERLQQDLEQAKKAKQERRVTEIERLLKLVNDRLKGLSELNIYSKGQPHGEE